MDKEYHLANHLENRQIKMDDLLPREGMVSLNIESLPTIREDYFMQVYISFPRKSKVPQVEAPHKLPDKSA